MPIYRLINPSDPYTFEAPNLEVAAVATVLLSTGFGAECIHEPEEHTPVLFGWDEWLKERGIDAVWLDAHTDEIADALDSFLIGGPNDRADVEDVLHELPEEKRAAWKLRRQDRHRSSLNQIGEAAYRLAEKLRKRVAATPAGGV